MLLFYCRAGFEADCAGEITEAALRAGADGRCEHRSKQAYVLWLPATKSVHRAWAPRIAELVFARQRIDRLRAVDDLRAPDRVTPVVAAAKDLGLRFSSVWIEAPDSEAGRRLLAPARTLADPLQAALREAGLLGSGDRSPRLHVCFVDRERGWIGVSNPQDSAPWPMGIPRLRSPSGAPSRSALKLVEALVTFVGEESLLTR